MTQQKRGLNLPELGNNVPRRGNRLLVWIGKFLLWATGWKFEGEFPNVKKLVIVGGPHTSYWDFFFAMSIIWALRLDISYMAKAGIFVFPVGGMLRRMGGIPIHREASLGVVGQVVEEFNRSDTRMLAIAPEGTRSRVKAWKTGFYRIAHGANVPVVAVTIHAKERIGRFHTPMMPTGDMENEIAEVRAHFIAANGFNADQGDI